MPTPHTQVWYSASVRFSGVFDAWKGQNAKVGPHNVALWVWSECNEVTQGRGAYRNHLSHFPINHFTCGVRRVRLYWSATFLIASV